MGRQGVDRGRKEKGRGEAGLGGGGVKEVKGGIFSQMVGMDSQGTRQGVGLNISKHISKGLQCALKVITIMLLWQLLHLGQGKYFYTFYMKHHLLVTVATSIKAGLLLFQNTIAQGTEHCQHHHILNSKLIMADVAQSSAFDEYYKNIPTSVVAWPEDYPSNVLTVPIYVDKHYLSKTPGIEVVSGPPGSGKTTAAVHMIGQLRKEARVLIVVLDEVTAKRLIQNISADKFHFRIKEGIMSHEEETSILNYEFPHIPIEVITPEEIRLLRDIKRDFIIIDDFEACITSLNKLPSGYIPRSSQILIREVGRKDCIVKLIDTMCTMAGALFARTIGSTVNSNTRFQNKTQGVIKEETSIAFTSYRRKLAPRLSDLLFTNPKRIHQLQDDTNYFQWYGHSTVEGRRHHAIPDGILLNLIYRVCQLRERIAVAVPSPTWVNLVNSLFHDKKKVVISSDMIEKSKTDQFCWSDKQIWKELRQCDVFVYNSPSVQVNTYHLFDSVFMIIPSVSHHGLWHQCRPEEIIWMAGKIRHPKTNKLFYAVHGKHNIPPAVDTHCHIRGGETPAYELLISTKELVASKLTMTTYEDYIKAVGDMTKRTFPGSAMLTTSNVGMTLNELSDICNNYKDVIEKGVSYARLLPCMNIVYEYHLGSDNFWSHEYVDSDETTMTLKKCNNDGCPCERGPLDME